MRFVISLIALQSSSRSTQTRVSRTRLWPFWTRLSMIFSSVLLERHPVRVSLTIISTFSCFFFGGSRARFVLQEIYHLIARNPDKCTVDSPWGTIQARHFGGHQVGDQSMLSSSLIFWPKFTSCSSPAQQNDFFCPFVLYYCTLLLISHSTCKVAFACSHVIIVGLSGVCCKI